MERTYINRKHPVLRGLKFFGFIILGAVAAAGFAFIFGYFVMLLWNWLMPTIFGLTTLTFWQAAGIVLLARLIFGGFKHGPGHTKSHSPRRKFMRHWKDEYKKERKCRDWRHFDDYWWDEGEKSYNDYLEHRKEEEQK
ncbi:hypothetical protein ACFLSE_05915 [Bacteroidota bacterium]